jgi:hypothetical protein
LIEDVAESTNISKRRHLGAMIKAFAVNRDQHCHGKHQQALTLTPAWRVTISLNDEPERLLVLPPVDEDIADKLMLLRVTRREMPMATETPDEMQTFWNALKTELPAFQHYLENWTVPESLRSPRFGIIHYHHPDILAALESLSPEHQLLEVIDKELFDYSYAERKAWTGLAAELHTRLTCDASKCRRIATALLHSPVSCGAFLSRLSNKRPDRVAVRRINGRSEYTITPPAPLPVAESR